MSVGLLIIDIQNDYFPGGKWELEGSEQAGHVAGKLLTFFREHKLPIAHIQHVAKPDAPFFVPGTPGVEIRPVVKPLPNETLIQKHFPNAFRETPLLDHLRSQGIGELVLTGMMTHMCVDAATRAAADLGFGCRIAEDGCATRALKLNDKIVPAPEVHAAFLAALNGAYGRVITADAIMKELQL